jgi:hypothetical protein
MSEIVVDSDHFSEFCAGGSSLTVSPQGISIQSLYRSFRDGSLIVNRQYQRKLVWTVSEKQRLIDSILKDYPLPLFLFADKNGALEVIDGMQRLNAIFGYIEHGFLLDEKCFNINEFARARQAAEKSLFKEFQKEVERLSAQQRADMLDYQLAVTIFPGEKNERITDVFGRINSGGKQLSDQERRQAGVLSPFAEVVRTLAAEIRGDVSRDTLLLSEMPEISIETSRDPHGYASTRPTSFGAFKVSYELAILERATMNRRSQTSVHRFCSKNPSRPRASS